MENNFTSIFLILLIISMPIAHATCFDNQPVQQANAKLQPIFQEFVANLRFTFPGISDEQIKQIMQEEFEEYSPLIDAFARPKTIAEEMQAITDPDYQGGLEGIDQTLERIISNYYGSLRYQGYIGHGAYGIVCKVFDTETQQTYAMKIRLHDSDNMNAEFEIQNELANAAVGSIPVPIRTLDNNAYLMELVEGEQEMYNVFETPDGFQFTPEFKQQLYELMEKIHRAGYRLPNDFFINLVVLNGRPFLFDVSRAQQNINPLVRENDRQFLESLINKAESEGLDAAEETSTSRLFNNYARNRCCGDYTYEVNNLGQITFTNPQTGEVVTGFHENVILVELFQRTPEYEQYLGTRDGAEYNLKQKDGQLVLEKKSPDTSDVIAEAEALLHPDLIADVNNVQFEGLEGIIETVNLEGIPVLGTGGQGSVYEVDSSRIPNLEQIVGEDTSGKSYVLKVVKPNSLQTTKSCVEGERMMLGVNHPNLMKVYAVGRTAEGYGVVIQEKVPGDTLETLRQRYGHTGDSKRVADFIQENPENFMLGLIQDIASGLQQMQDIVHKDIKPKNILVYWDGTRPRAVLIDYGLIESENLMEESEFILGTALFMSPEQATGKPLDKRSDQFALALTAYQLLTRNLILQGSDETALDFISFIATVDEHFVRQKVNTLGISKDAKSILLRMLSPDAKHRYTNEQEIIDDINTLLKIPVEQREQGIITQPIQVLSQQEVRADTEVSSKVVAIPNSEALRQQPSLTQTQADYAVLLMELGVTENLEVLATRLAELDVVVGHSDRGVLEQLQNMKPNDRALHLAALLHDIGKTGPPGLNQEQRRVMAKSENFAHDLDAQMTVQRLYGITGVRGINKETSIKDFLDAAQEQGKIDQNEKGRLILMLETIENPFTGQPFDINNDQMHHFWEAHTFWGIQILNQAGIDPAVIKIVSEHHKFDYYTVQENGEIIEKVWIYNFDVEGTKAERVPASQAADATISPEGELLLQADKYDAFRRRGGFSSAQALQSINEQIDACPLEFTTQEEYGGFVSPVETTTEVDTGTQEIEIQQQQEEDIGVEILPELEFSEGFENFRTVQGLPAEMSIEQALEQGKVQFIYAIDPQTNARVLLARFVPSGLNELLDVLEDRFGTNNFRFVLGSMEKGITKLLPFDESSTPLANEFIQELIKRVAVTEITQNPDQYKFETNIPGSLETDFKTWDQVVYESELLRAKESLEKLESRMQEESPADEISFENSLDDRNTLLNYLAQEILVHKNLPVGILGGIQEIRNLLTKVQAKSQNEVLTLESWLTNYLIDEYRFSAEETPGVLQPILEEIGATDPPSRTSEAAFAQTEVLAGLTVGTAAGLTAAFYLGPFALLAAPLYGLFKLGQYIYNQLTQSGALQIETPISFFGRGIENIPSLVSFYRNNIKAANEMADDLAVELGGATPTSYEGQKAVEFVYKGYNVILINTADNNINTAKANFNIQGNTIIISTSTPKDIIDTIVADPLFMPEITDSKMRRQGATDLVMDIQVAHELGAAQYVIDNGLETETQEAHTYGAMVARELFKLTNLNEQSISEIQKKIEDRRIEEKNRNDFLNDARNRRSRFAKPLPTVHDNNRAGFRATLREMGRQSLITKGQSIQLSDAELIAEGLQAARDQGLSATILDTNILEFSNNEDFTKSGYPSFGKTYKTTGISPEHQRRVKNGKYDTPQDRANADAALKQSFPIEGTAPFVRKYGQVLSKNVLVEVARNDPQIIEQALQNNEQSAEAIAKLQSLTLQTIENELKKLTADPTTIQSIMNLRRRNINKVVRNFLDLKADGIQKEIDGITHGFSISPVDIAIVEAAFDPNSVRSPIRIIRTKNQDVKELWELMVKIQKPNNEIYVHIEDGKRKGC